MMLVLQDERSHFITRPITDEASLDKLKALTNKNVKLKGRTYHVVGVFEDDQQFESLNPDNPAQPEPLPTYVGEQKKVTWDELKQRADHFKKYKAWPV